MGEVVPARVRVAGRWGSRATARLQRPLQDVEDCAAREDGAGSTPTASGGSEPSSARGMVVSPPSAFRDARVTEARGRISLQHRGGLRGGGRPPCGDVQWLGLGGASPLAPTRGPILHPSAEGPAAPDGEVEAAPRVDEVSIRGGFPPVTLRAAPRGITPRRLPRFPCHLRPSPPHCAAARRPRLVPARPLVVEHAVFLLTGGGGKRLATA